MERYGLVSCQESYPWGTGFAQSEQGKLISEIVTERSLGYYRPSVLFFRYISGMPIICEYSDDNRDFVTEVVTGRQYPRLNNPNDLDRVRGKLAFHIEESVSAKYVANILRSLKAQGLVERVPAELDKLENAMRIGYKREQEKLNRIKRENEKNEEYIKSFRKYFN